MDDAAFADILVAKKHHLQCALTLHILLLEQEGSENHLGILDTQHVAQTGRFLLDVILMI